MKHIIYRAALLPFLVGGAVWLISFVGAAFLFWGISDIDWYALRALALCGFGVGASTSTSVLVKHWGNDE